MQLMIKDNSYICSPIHLIQDATAWDYKREAEKTAVAWYLICRLS